MKNNTLLPLLILVVGFSLIALIMLSKTFKPEETNKVRIDSVSVKLRNPVLPDKVWVYHTKIGSFTANTNRFNVGDSIQVTIIKTR